MKSIVLASLFALIASAPALADPITYGLVKTEAQKAGFVLGPEKPDQNRMNMSVTIGGVKSVFDVFLSGCDNANGCQEIGFSGDRMLPAAKASDAAKLVAEFTALGKDYTASSNGAGASIKIIGDYRYRRPNRGLEAANALNAVNAAIGNWKKGLAVLTKPL